MWYVILIGKWSLSYKLLVTLQDIFWAIPGLQRIKSIALRRADAVEKWVDELVLSKFRFASFLRRGGNRPRGDDTL